MSLALKLCLLLSVGVWLASAAPLLLLIRRLWKLSPARPRRTFGIAVFLQVIGAVVFGAALWIATRRADAAPVGTAALLGLAVLIAAAVECALFAGPSGGSRIRRAGAWLTTMLAAGTATLATVAFVRFLFLEGFIVPTGAMATTVVGAHADRVCVNCGYSFMVSLSVRVADGRRRGDPIPAPPLTTFCPNCRLRCVIPREEPIRKGDRILTDKADEPTRWDLIVFRSPKDPTQKYLSRLVGLPDEQIELMGGEVFVNGKLMRKPPGVANDLWMQVHDTKFAPSETTDETPRWRAAERSGWKQAHGQWKCAARSRAARLEFAGSITDAVAYNAQQPGELDSSSVSPVGDVRVECRVERLAGAGRFGLNWQFQGGQARLRIGADGAVSIRTRHADVADADDEIKGASMRPIRPGDRIVFAVRDGQAYVEHAAQVAALLPFGPEGAERHRLLIEQRPRSESCELALVSEDCAVALSRIIVYRDVYYQGREQERVAAQRLRGVGEPVLLESDEYFVLGENNARSYDSRFYGGLRTADLIGVARWLYWPPSRSHVFQ